jgi:hypothetical protein
MATRFLDVHAVFAEHRAEFQDAHRTRDSNERDHRPTKLGDHQTCDEE